VGWKYQDVSIYKKHPFLFRAIAGSKGNIGVYGCLILDMETDPFISPAEGAFIVRTADGYLENNAVSLTWRTDYVPFIVHNVSE